MKKLLIVFALFLAVAHISAQSPVFYIAHRGASYLAPENTIAAANLAWQLNADAVECDVYLSSDNRVMVIHDKDTKCTSGGATEYLVAQSSSDLLRMVDVGSFKSLDYIGEKIPFIEELLSGLPQNKTLVIEIKCGSEILPFLKKAVHESNKTNQVVFISFGFETILATKKEFPENKCYYLSMNPLELKKKMRYCARNGIDGVNLYHKIINKNIIKVANMLQLEVLAWTVDSPEVANKLIDLGVTKITSNRPDWLKQQIGQ
jgi:glycerophosphoryl diester phosphodiesterase